MHPCSECVVGMADSERDSQAEAVLRELEGEGAEAAMAPIAQALQLPQVILKTLKDALQKILDGMDANASKHAMHRFMQDTQLLTQF